MFWAIVIIIILFFIYAGRESSYPPVSLEDVMNCRINALSDQIEEIRRMLIDIDYEVRKEKEEEEF